MAITAPNIWSDGSQIALVICVLGIVCVMCGMGTKTMMYFKEAVFRQHSL